MKNIRNRTERNLEYEVKTIEEYYPGINKLLNCEVLMRGEFSSDHDFQFFIASERKFAKECKSSLVKMYDSKLTKQDKEIL